MQKCSNSSTKTWSASTKNKVVVIGATGRLGSAIVQTAAKNWEVEGVSAREGKIYGEADCWIYAGLGDTLLLWLEKAVKAGQRLVIGTTGLHHEEWESIQAAALQIPLFYSPNFSLGIALMKKWASEMAEMFPFEAKVAITETHHAGKRDAPSGTALDLARTIEKKRLTACPIASIREGEVVGKHILSFQTREETLAISHEAHSLLAFGRGALQAACFLQGKKAGLYGMEELCAEFE